MVPFGHFPDERGGEPAPGWAGVGTVTLRETSTGPVGRPVLLDHHCLLLVTVGHGVHEVDFRAYQCRPGTLIWARPGQVVRYDFQAGFDAILLCWEPAVAADLAAIGAGDNPFGPTRWQLAGEDEDAVINEVSQLVVDCQRHQSGERAAGLLRHQLAVLLLRIALLPGGDRRAATEETATFQRLRHELERFYGHTRRVEEYADRLGCSVRTLTRACLAATGRTAKQVIDDRVALQAMRLLAATDTSVAEVGRSLGFSEPTNFGRFFQREVGRSPGAFRARLHEPAAHPVPAQRKPAPSEALARSPLTGPVRR
jgi:AraC-like DNA-binding protein